MAKDKNSFLLYCDLIHTVSKMPNDKAGELFKHILSYVNDENPISEDLIIQLTFEPIKQSLKRDLQKYENIRLKNIDNANKRWNKNNAVACGRIPNDAKNAVSDSDSVSVSDSVTDVVDVLPSPPPTTENLTFEKNTIKFHYEKFMLTDNSQKDVLCMANQKTKKEIEIACIGFVLHLLSSGETLESYKPDFAKHFKSWCNKFGLGNLNTIDKSQINQQFKKLNMYQDGN